MTNNNYSLNSVSTSLNAPLVSVVLPVYNGRVYLAESIQSILKQTYTNIELIIINDGSTDDSAEIVSTFNDPRIRFYGQSNHGLPAALNRAIELANGEYIARQDADDVSLPKRLERQVDFLNKHTDYGVVGTWAKILSGSQETVRSHKHPVGNEQLKFSLLFDSYFVHSSVMLRRNVLDTVGLYVTEKARQPEDYELWSRIVRNGQFKVANIPEILVIYREVADSICRINMNQFADRVRALCIENLAWSSGRSITDPVITDIAALVHGASHRLSSKPDFRAMWAVLQESATRVGGPLNANTQLVKEVRERYKAIKYNYFRILPIFMVRKFIRTFSLHARENRDV